MTKEIPWTFLNGEDQAIFQTKSYKFIFSWETNWDAENEDSKLYSLQVDGIAILLERDYKTYDVAINTINNTVIEYLKQKTKSTHKFLEEIQGYMT